MTQFDAGFSERLKIKDDAVATTLSQHCICCSLLCFGIYGVNALDYGILKKAAFVIVLI